MNATPIKSSAQARLLLYRLLSSKLSVVEKRIIEADPSSWDRLIFMLEQALSNETELKADQPVLAQAFSSIDRVTKEGLQKQVVRLTGKSLWLGIPATGLLESFIAEHTQLIKSVQREHLDKISLVVKRGIRDGRLGKDIAKEIHQQTNISKRRSLLIARNAPLQYSGALTKHHQTSAGIKSYRWQTSQDERVRDAHKKLDGQVRSWDSPGPHPRSEVNCRCDAVPVIN